MRSLVPVGHFRNISGHLFTWLVCGSFQWRHGLLFTDCIVRWQGQSDWFKKITLDPLRIMEYRVSKASTVSIITAVPRSGELRTQKLKSPLVRKQSLNVLPLKPGLGQYIAIHATLTARDFFLTYLYPSGPFTCIFSKTSPDFSCVDCG